MHLVEEHKGALAVGELHIFVGANYILSVRNNHARDFGEAGRDSSMAALDAVGIRHSGREGTWAEMTVKGVRVAMIAFTPNVGANSLNDHDIAVERVRALAVTNDIVIVSFHAGAEGDGAERLPFGREYYVGEDRGDVVYFARAMVDAGADLLLGHGPHVPRAMELYRGRLIAYSLGNFVFSAHSPGTQNTGILEIQFAGESVVGSKFLPATIRASRPVLR